MNHVKKNQSGFTLIELVLAMAFISMLLLAIALTVLQISETYNRGLTLKEVDQASRTISDDLSRDITNTPTFSLQSGSNHYVTQAWGGSLCLGRYSYVWNFGKALSTYSAGQTTSINLLNDSNGVKSVFNIVKVIDANGSMCANANPKVISSASATELLQNTDHNLAVHEFCATTDPAANDSLTGQQLYTLAFTLGTNDAAALTTSTAPACAGTNQNDGLLQCKDPSQSGADLQYCTVQEFSLVVRAQNAVN
jgi:prepilin-type N-terminal cleavage/methylation domain-containing protein